MTGPYRQGPQPGGQYPGNQPGGYQPGGYPTGSGFGTFGGYPSPPSRRLASRGAFWLSLAAVFVIAAGIVVGLVLTSGGGDSGKQLAGGGGSGSNSGSSSTAPTDPSSSGSARTTSSGGGGTGQPLGKAISAKGQDDGERLAITAVAYDNAAVSTSDYDQPPAGEHFVTVKWLLNNTGTTHYKDAVDNCVDVVDSNGRKYKITIVSHVSSGPVIDSVDIAPGGTRTGWSVFAVPVGARIVQTSYTMDSGFGGGGSWQI